MREDKRLWICGLVLLCIAGALGRIYFEEILPYLFFNILYFCIFFTYMLWGFIIFTKKDDEIKTMKKKKKDFLIRFTLLLGFALGTAHGIVWGLLIPLL